MKSITSILLLIISCVGSITSYSQQKAYYSFTESMFPAQEDTNKVNALNTFCKRLIENNNLNDAFTCANTALEIGEKAAFIKGQGETYHLLATIYIRQCNYSL